MLPEIGLAKGACTLWEEELLFDYTIEVGDEQFKVHKVVMASVSDYFKAMLTGCMLESREDRVRLEGLNSLAVKNVIQFVYTGEFGSAKASAEDLLACAVYLQISAAAKISAASLCEQVNKENCFHILSLFRSYAIADGIERTVSFMKHNIDNILSDCRSEDMTYEEFLILMDCWGRSEWQLFVLAMQWLKKDNVQRKKHVNEIMRHIRFCLMTPTELAFITSMKEMHVISDSDNPWYDLVEIALKYHDLPIHQKVLEESEQAKVRTEPSPVCFGLDSSLMGKLFAVHQGKSWTSYDTVNPLVFRDDVNFNLPFTCIEINNFFVICINSGEDDVQCSVFDPRTLTWSAIAPMGVPRDECALVYHDKHLYALGGHDRRVEDTDEATDVIEKYDFHTNTWSVITSKLPVAMCDNQAFSIDGCIYIPGLGDLSDTVYCFDPNASEWSEKAPSLPGPGSNMVYVEIDGEKVLAYIDEDIKLHYYKPSVDNWLVYDRCVPSKLKAGDAGMGNLLATKNTIYFLDFLDRDEDDRQPDDIELPCVSEKWTFCEDGLGIDSKILQITDQSDSGWTLQDFTNIYALLSIIPLSVRRGSAALP